MKNWFGEDRSWDCDFDTAGYKLWLAQQPVTDLRCLLGLNISASKTFAGSITLGVNITVPGAETFLQKQVPPSVKGLTISFRRCSITFANILKYLNKTFVLCQEKYSWVSLFCTRGGESITFQHFFPLITAKWTLNLILLALFHIQ